MCRGQVAPRSRCTLPYLRLDVGSRGIDRATDHKHVSVRQRGARRIPSTVVHIRQSGPGVIQRVIRIGVGQPDPVAYLLPTGYEELSIDQRGEAGTENVSSYMLSLIHI